MCSAGLTMKGSRNRVVPCRLGSTCRRRLLVDSMINGMQHESTFAE